MTLALEEHEHSLETDVHFVEHQKWRTTSIKYGYLDSLVWVPAGMLMRYLPSVWRLDITTNDTSKEIIKWISENVNGLCYYSIGDFYFSDEIDAMAFKLRWT